MFQNNAYGYAPAGWENSLGAAARQRKTASDQAADASHAQMMRDNPSAGLYGPMKLFGSSQLSGPLPDPQWDAYFEALRQAGATGMRDDLSPGNINAAANTVQQPGMESNQVGREGIGGALARMSPSVTGIDTAIKRFGRGR